MAAAYDVVIIGGGHNGLTAAAYVADAGHKVLVLERRAVLGGAAVTEEFYPGYRNSICSYVASLLNPTVMGDLDLAGHGLEFLPLASSFYPKLDGRYLLLTDDDSWNRAEIGKFSDKDYEAKQRFDAMLKEAADLISQYLLRPPPPLIEGRLGIGELLTLGKAGVAFRRLQPETRHRLAQLFTSSVQSLMERYFESDALRLLYYKSSIAGSFMGLDQLGSAINLLHLSLGEINGVRGQWAFARGGMGAISEALATAARTRGAEIRTSAPVAKIVIEQGRAVGVRLETGDTIRARCVLSNCEPKRTFLGLIDEVHLESEFRADIAGWRTESGSFRMNLALRELPDFSCLPGTKAGIHHKGFINLVSSTDAIHRTFLQAKAGEWPDEPLITIVIPSTLDDSLAPSGHHVVSVFCQHFPYELSDGRSWDDHKETVANLVIETIQRYAPNLKDALVGWQALTPLDLEREYGLTGGDVYHGKMELDQLFAMRPHPTCANYRTPVGGLYLCGGGTHPGGGVSGAPGYNAAQRVIKDLR